MQTSGFTSKQAGSSFRPLLPSSIMLTEPNFGSKTQCFTDTQ